MRIKLVWVAAALFAAAMGCSAAKKDNGGGDGTNNNGGGAGMGSTSNPMGGASGNGSNPMSGASGSGSMSSGGGGSSGSNPMSGASGNGSSGSGASNAGGTGGKDKPKPPMEQVEMLDKDVDWTALTLVYAPMYSAYDGMHVFQVPVHVDGATVDLSGWQAIPSDAVTFDPDPDVAGGVLVTIAKGVEEITIAAHDGMIGGTALLKVTVGTPDDWDVGEKRYHNGVDFDLPDIDFASAILDPNWMPPAPPPNLACNNCHSTGAKYFEIQHTPTQCARFSDEDLKIIFTMGMKPPGVGFRVLPPMLGDTTAEKIYSDYHRWDSTEAEQKGLIIYLRSLTPTGQGDILLPDGSYAPPGGSIDAGTM
jgi:hypothetical protein